MIANYARDTSQVGSFRSKRDNKTGTPILRLFGVYGIRRRHLKINTFEYTFKVLT